jgi:hypothetical protein
VRVAGAVVFVGIVALAGGWELGSTSALAGGPGHVGSITFIFDYADGAQHYLGDGPYNGCGYENCPIALDSGTNSMVLNSILLANPAEETSSSSAVISSITSSPSGIGEVGTEVPISLITGEMVWAALPLSYPSSSVTYSITVVVTAS